MTAVEFDLHPAPHLYGGRMMWPAERAPEVLAAFREITAEAPEELTLWEVVAPAEVLNRVTGYRAASTSWVDTVPSP
ncbi:hypothetical protein FHR32_002510 [Streptosporangium album]|uniref:Uncharacterized protein n=1 Tax=Streptosporangium album TaxID=47479 RepID=A0A7W7W9M0_9ACTN|nr:hypothetical protein [Streptosporangium album]MBB4938205.1 hypothetical protein [Streptosporangium album]